VAILREQAEPIGVQIRRPAPLCWAIERCLAKEPISVTSPPEISHGNLQPYATASRRDLLSRWKPRPSNIPVQRTGFVGREKEVAAAKELLLRQNVRLVTVTGPGGSEKRASR